MFINSSGNVEHLSSQLDLTQSESKAKNLQRLCEYSPTFRALLFQPDIPLPVYRKELADNNNLESSLVFFLRSHRIFVHPRCDHISRRKKNFACVLDRGNLPRSQSANRIEQFDPFHYSLESSTAKHSSTPSIIAPRFNKCTQ